MLLCLLCVIDASCCVGQDAATRVGAGGTVGDSGEDRPKDRPLRCFGCGRLCSPGGGARRSAEPEDLRSVDGLLKVDLAFRSYISAKGEKRYCYVTIDGEISSTLRVKPGDTVILNFKNEAAVESAGAGRGARTDAATRAEPHGKMNMSGGTSGTAGDSSRTAR